MPAAGECSLFGSEIVTLASLLHKKVLAAMPWSRTARNGLDNRKGCIKIVTSRPDHKGMHDCLIRI